MGQKKGTTVVGTENPLLQELGRGLLKLLLGAVGLLMAYGGYLLAPHMRETVYGYFGRPTSNLDRAWNWLQNRVNSVSEAGSLETKPTPLENAGGEERLMEQLKKNRELLEEQRRGLERLGIEQERTADQLRWTSTREGSREGWLPFLGKFLVGSGLSNFLGWLFGGRQTKPATREDLNDLAEDLAEQHTELDHRRNAAQLVDDAIQSQHARELTFIENIARGVLHQVNTFAAMQGLQVWIPDLNPGGGHFEDPNGGGAGGGGGNNPPAGGAQGPEAPQPQQPQGGGDGPILEEGAGVAPAGPAERAAGEAAGAGVEQLGAVPVVAQGPEAAAAAAAAEEPPAQNVEGSPMADGIAAAAGVAVGVGVAAQLGAVAVPVAVPVAGGMAVGGAAVAMMGAVPAVAVAGVLGLAAAAGVRGALGAGGWLLQRAFGFKPEKAPTVVREAGAPAAVTPPASVAVEGEQQRLQQLVEGREVPSELGIIPEAREMLGQRAGLAPAQPNLVDAALRRAGEEAVREESVREAAAKSFGQRLWEGARGYWNRLWGQQPRSLGNGEARDQRSENGLGQRVKRYLGQHWQQQEAVHDRSQIPEVRQAVKAEDGVREKVPKGFNSVKPPVEGAGKGLVKQLADVSGLGVFKKNLDDFNEGVQKTVRTVNMLWEKKGWAGLALGGAYVGVPLLRVALNLARGRPDAAVGALVRHEVTRQPPGQLEVAAGEVWRGVRDLATDPIFMDAMQMAAGVLTPKKGWNHSGCGSVS